MDLKVEIVKDQGTLDLCLTQVEEDSGSERGGLVILGSDRKKKGPTSKNSNNR